MKFTLLFMLACFAVLASAGDQCDRLVGVLYEKGDYRIEVTVSGVLLLFEQEFLDGKPKVHVLAANLSPSERFLVGGYGRGRAVGFSDQRLFLFLNRPGTFELPQNFRPQGARR